jgi:hypothetical protein
MRSLLNWNSAAAHGLGTGEVEQVRLNFDQLSQDVWIARIGRSSSYWLRVIGLTSMIIIIGLVFYELSQHTRLQNPDVFRHRQYQLWVGRHSLPSVGNYYKSVIAQIIVAPNTNCFKRSLPKKWQYDSSWHVCRENGSLTFEASQRIPRLKLRPHGVCVQARGHLAGGSTAIFLGYTTDFAARSLNVDNATRVSACDLMMLAVADSFECPV